jgi:nucleotide-binding universal stress UspA family protein
MRPLQTILLATDFSERSDAAFRQACSLTRQCGARLYVLHVGVPPLSLTDRSLSPGHSDPLREARLAAVRAHHPAPPDVEVEYRLAEGDPADEVLRAARELGCDLIVMGTHGRSGLSRWFMGSVTEQVLREAACPVLAVKVPAPEEAAAAAEGAELGEISHT